MTDAAQIRVPAWFWAVSGMAFLWSLVGVFSYLVQAYGGGPAMQSGMSDAQTTLDASTPAWVTGAYAIAVFAGLFGAIGLLVRREWAKLLLIISLLAALVQFVWVLFFSEALELLGNEAAVLPVTIIAVCAALVYFSYYADRKGWLG